MCVGVIILLHLPGWERLRDISFFSEWYVFTQVFRTLSSAKSSCSTQCSSTAHRFARSCVTSRYTTMLAAEMGQRSSSSRKNIWKWKGGYPASCCCCCSSRLGLPYKLYKKRARALTLLCGCECGCAHSSSLDPWEGNDRHLLPTLPSPPWGKCTRLPDLVHGQSQARIPSRGALIGCGQSIAVLGIGTAWSMSRPAPVCRNGL